MLAERRFGDRLDGDGLAVEGEVYVGRKLILIAVMVAGISLLVWAGVDLDGKKVSLADFKGKPVFVNFWATWCEPCKLEMPWLEDFSKKYKPQGLVMLGVSTDDAGKDVVAKTVKKLGVTYPILLKNDKIEDAYGLEYMPMSFYVDKTGKVLIATAGISDGQGGKDAIEANIQKLLAAGGQ